VEIATIPRSPLRRASSLSLLPLLPPSSSSPSPLLTYAPEWSRLPSYLPTGYRPSPGRSLSQPSDPESEPYGPSDEERWERGRPRRGAVHRLDAALTSLTVGRVTGCGR
jgi:hypothetical protein